MCFNYQLNCLIYQLFKQNLTADGYKVIIKEFIAPYVRQNEPITLLEDNSPTHSAAESRRCMRDNMIRRVTFNIQY